MGEVRFSVIIPVLNRREILPRAIDSVRAQRRDDVEVVVVDDGSTDGTPDVVEGYRDPRVRLLRHAVNRGVCAARNTAIEAAVGDWCVMLDSDFELLPGAFETLARLCDEAPADVANVATVCTWSDRGDTPDPLPETDLLLDYPAYLRFVAGLQTSEWFSCIRRSALRRVRFPEGRAYEATFHLALARAHRFQLRRERVVRIHTDAPERITVAAPARFARRVLRDARDGAAEAENILRVHGAAMAAEAPAFLDRTVEVAFQSHLLAGERMEALAMFGRLSPARQRSPRLLANLALGLVDRRVAARAQGWWRARNRA
jgi:glycosyltransferase involved in cell wall biosynthesis